jgi:hypothetical protein
MATAGRMTPALRTVRWVSFVAQVASIVGACCWLATRMLPPLRTEPPSLLLLPMPGITCVVALLLYPFIQKQRSSAGRIGWMYIAFLISLVLYGVYLWWFIPDGTVALILLALLAGHFYGWPAFLAILLTWSLTDRVLFATPPALPDPADVDETG